MIPISRHLGHSPLRIARGDDGGACGRRRGTALIAVMVLIFIVAIVLTGLVMGGGRDHDLTTRRIETLQAFYAAEAGMNMSIREMMLGIDEDGDGRVGTISDDEDDSNNPRLGSADILVSSETVDEFMHLTSRGMNTHARRLLRATMTEVTIGRPDVQVRSIAAGTMHSIGIRENGTVVGWGFYDPDHDYTAAKPPEGLDNVIAVAAGWDHSVALRADGTVVCWGHNGYGQCDVPPGLNDVVSITCGAYHTMALRADGTVVCWGYDAHGVSTPPADLDDAVMIAAGLHHALAVRANGRIVVWGISSWGLHDVPAGLTAPIAVDADNMHCVALNADGTVYCWGNNGWGQCAVPQNLEAVNIAAGPYHTLATRHDGSVIGWGENLDQMASGGSGLRDIVEVAAGGHHSLGLRADGRVFGWGQDLHGETVTPRDPSDDRFLDIGTSHHHGLALRDDGVVFAWGYNSQGQAEVPDNLDAAIAVAAGVQHSLALQIDGTVRGWGWNANNISRPPNNLKDVIRIAAGERCSVALKSDGTVVAWGHPIWGGKAPNNLGAAIDISAGWYHAAAVLVDGTVVCWGSNQYGQCNVPADLGKAVAVRCGAYNTAAILEDGRIVVWGRDENDLLTPLQDGDPLRDASIGALFGLAADADGLIRHWGWTGYGIANPPEHENIVRVEAGTYHGMALDSDGRLYLWGANTHGQLNGPGDDIIFRVGLPVGHWRFDEEQGTIAADFSGSANDGTLFNSPMWTAGRFNGALEFNGASQFVRADQISADLEADSFTVSLWARPASVTRGALAAFNTDGGSTQRHLILWARSGSDARFSYYDPTVGYRGGDDVFALNDWHHVVVRIDAEGRGTLFVNGESRTNWQTDLMPDHSQAGLFSIAQRFIGNMTTGDFFDGRIDEVRVYRTSLSDREVEALYSAGSRTQMRVQQWAEAGH